MTNAITKAEQSVSRFLDDYTPRLGQYTERVDEFRKDVQIAITSNEKLSDCLSTADGVASMYQALRLAASTGLSLNPQLGEAALVPYKGKVQFLTMKNGLIRQAQDTGKVEFMTAEMVREKDEIKIGKTADGDTLEHWPSLRERGNVIGYYAVLKLKDGKTHVKYMSKEEAQEWAANYGSYQGKLKQNWRESFDGMAVKTVLKALLRNVYISPEVTRSVVAEDMSVYGETPLLESAAEEVREAVAEVVDAETGEVETEADGDGENRKAVL
jgi:recombination protein RecT